MFIVIFLSYRRQVVCEPVPPDVFNTIEVFCIVLFTMDYGLRVLLVMFMPPR